jgi:hypothetical protein
MELGANIFSKIFIYIIFLLLLIGVLGLRLICFGWILVITGLFQAFLIPIHLFITTRFIQRLPLEALTGQYAKYLAASYFTFFCFFLFQADINDVKVVLPLELLLGKNSLTAFVKEYSLWFVSLAASLWVYILWVMHKINAQFR